MRDCLEQPRLIYVMRDPVDRLISQYIHQWSQGEIHCGLDQALTQLVNAFKSAAQGYGIEKRVLLLHGPVGSSKSTIAQA